MDESREQLPSPEDVPYVKGCPLCEESDAELQRGFGEFAQWLYGVMVNDQKKRRNAAPSDGVDIGRSMDTLKERSAEINKQHNE